MMRLMRMIVIVTLVSVLMCGRGYAETVHIVAEDDWYPYCAGFDGGARGIAVDITRAAFNAANVNVMFDVMNYDQGMGLVRAGEAIGCFDAPRTEEIEQVYLWHDEPLLLANGYFYAVATFEKSIDSVADAAGLRVGLTQGYGYGNVIDFDTAMMKQYSKRDDIVLKKLIANRVDLAIFFDKVADYLVSKMGLSGSIKQVGRAESIDIYIAFSKKHSDGQKYRDIFSEGFRLINENGVYAKIWDEWNDRLKGAE